MSEQRIRYNTPMREPCQPAIVNVPLQVDEAQMIYRLRQLRNAGWESALVRLSELQVVEPRPLDNP